MKLTPVHEVDRASNIKYHYIGRSHFKYDFPKSALANPFRLGSLPRGETLSSYRKWLWGRIKAGDRNVIDELLSLNDDTVLVCHCIQPGPCHGHVVIKAVEWLNSKDCSREIRDIISQLSHEWHSNNRHHH